MLGLFVLVCASCVWTPDISPHLTVDDCYVVERCNSSYLLDKEAKDWYNNCWNWLSGTGNSTDEFNCFWPYVNRSLYEHRVRPVLEVYFNSSTTSGQQESLCPLPVNGISSLYTHCSGCTSESAAVYNSTTTSVVPCAPALAGISMHKPEFVFSYNIGTCVHSKDYLADKDIARDGCVEHFRSDPGPVEEWL